MTDCRFPADTLEMDPILLVQPAVKPRAKKKQAGPPASMRKEPLTPERSQIILRVIDRLKTV